MYVACSPTNLHKSKATGGIQRDNRCREGRCAWKQLQAERGNVTYQEKAMNQHISAAAVLTRHIQMDPWRDESAGDPDWISKLVSWWQLGTNGSHVVQKIRESLQLTCMLCTASACYTLQCITCTCNTKNSDIQFYRDFLWLIRINIQWQLDFKHNNKKRT